MGEDDRGEAAFWTRGDDFRRVWNRFSDHENRIRSLEALQAPAQKEAFGRFHEIERKVAEMDIHGTTVMQVRLKNIEDDIHEIKTAITKDREDRADEVRAVRQLWRSGLIAVGSGVAINVVLIFVNQAVT